MPLGDVHFLALFPLRYLRTNNFFYFDVIVEKEYKLCYNTHSNTIIDTQGFHAHICEVDMLSNLHTHTNFCDGKSTPEEIVLSAIDMGFCSIGFSGHGYTDFDKSYCMTDTNGYINQIKALKEKYQDKIQIYLGVEEDIAQYVCRENFDYIIGSSHYFNIDGKLHPIDLSAEYFKKCIELFGEDVKTLSENYYSNFCDYIICRKPDIIGHFDLITKFDETDGMGYFLNNSDYIEIAEKYLKIALKSECIFEVNTGAISRGYRTNPYPQENLLHILKESDAKIMLTSDSHSADTLCFGFDQTRSLLKDIGFSYVYVLYDGKFQKQLIE